MAHCLCVLTFPKIAQAAFTLILDDNRETHCDDGLSIEVLVEVPRDILALLMLLTSLEKTPR